MSNTKVSTLEWLGIRLGTLGSASDVPIAFPLAEGDPDVDAHTDASRIGFYGDRSAGAEKVGVVVMGTDSIGFFDDRVEVLGATVWHATNLPNPETQTNKGAANGYAPLDASAKLPSVYLPTSVVGGVTYKGVWDALTNTPTLTSGAGALGDFYIVSVAGATPLDGITTWLVGDLAVFNGTAWERVPDGDRSVVRAQASDPSPGYLDSKVDGTTIGINGSNELEVIAGGVTPNAAGVSVDTSGFTGILSGADTNAQLAFDTIDVHTHSLDQLSNVSLATGVALTNATPVQVDTSITGTAWKWWVNIKDSSGNSQTFEVLAARQLTPGDDAEFTILPATADFPHTVEVNYVAGTVELVITASGVGYTADVRRFEMP